MSPTPEPSPDPNDVRNLARLNVERDPSFGQGESAEKTPQPAAPESTDPNDVRRLARLNVEKDPRFGARKAGPKGAQPAATAALDSNGAYAHLRTNEGRRIPRDYHDEARQIRRWHWKRFLYVLKVVFALFLVNLACLKVAMWFNWEPRVAVPVLSLGLLMTVGTLWVLFVVNGR